MPFLVGDCSMISNLISHMSVKDFAASVPRGCRNVWSLNPNLFMHDQIYAGTGRLEKQNRKSS